MQGSRKMAVLGVTGFIGRGLPAMAAARGWTSTGISRSGAGEVAAVSGWQTPQALDLAGHQAVINLAGEPISRRWTEANKRRFHESRVALTLNVVEAIRVLPADQRPEVLINGSAVGIYGDRGDELLSEQSNPGEGYLAELCGEWEAAAKEAEELGVRVVCLRTGVVLGRQGEAFERLRRIFSFGLGGRLGNGRQWLPWIHVEDLRAAILHCLESAAIRGPVNGVAPAPERNLDFTRKLARALHRPAILPVPGFALKLALGGFGGALLEGQRAIPGALQADGFEFRHPALEGALAALL